MANNEANLPSAEYYVDISSEQLLLGKLAVDAHIEAGGNLAYIKNVSSLLDAKYIGETRTLSDEIASWDNQEIIAYGKWLLGMLSSPEDSKQKTLNEGVLRSAWSMGLGPGPWTIRHRFGSVSQFYAEIGAKNTHRAGIFDDWTLEDYVQYVKGVGKATGSRPTLSQLKKRSIKDPFNPDPVGIYKRFKEIGGIRKLQELAGYPVIDFWNDEDFIDWGVKFMKANDGLSPSARMIAFLSRKKRGPSTYPIQQRFGGVKKYKDLVTEAFIVDKAEKRFSQENKLESISRDLENGSLPTELFKDVEDGQEKIVRAAKYRIAHHLLGPPFADSMMTISSGKIPFVNGIRKANPTVSAGDIESTALFMDAFDDIWPMDEYLRALRLGEDYDEFTRRELQKRRVKEELVSAL